MKTLDIRTLKAEALHLTDDHSDDPTDSLDLIPERWTLSPSSILCYLSLRLSTALETLYIDLAAVRAQSSRRVMLITARQSLCYSPD